MKLLFIIIFIFLINGCTHHLVGKQMQPFHPINHKGYHSSRGSWASVNYNYKVLEDTIFIDGEILFDKNTEFQEWDHVEVKMNFYFIDAGNIVKDVKTRQIIVGGRNIGKKILDFSFPYEKTFKYMRFDIKVRGYI